MTQPAVYHTQVRRVRAPKAHDGDVMDNQIVGKPANGMEDSDLLVVEEPLAIRLAYRKDNEPHTDTVSITMRTPGHDFELAAGFLFTEGIIADRTAIVDVRYSDEDRNSVTVTVSPDTQVDLKKLERHFYTTSSCGICGKTSIEAIFTSRKAENQNEKIGPARTTRFTPETIHAMPDRVRERQTVFKYTGGLHAAALFQEDGILRMVREDVGRHNAVDKLIGAALFEELLPLEEFLIFVSGRASFELIQKSVMGGLPVLAAVGAPSSLALDLARESGMTLLGFVRNHSFNIYSGEERIFQESL